MKQINPIDTRILCLKLHIHLLINKGKKIVFTWIPSHIGIEGNERADTLAKEALNLPIDPNKNPKLPYSDYRPKVKKHILSLWNTEWEEEKEKQNKLFEIKPKLKPRSPHSLSRKESVVLTRLKIGHTKLTHQHLLAKEEAPVCVGCNSNLTVKHILLDCVDFSNSRFKYFKSESLKALFDTIDPRKIIAFISEIDMLKQIKYT